MKWLTPGALNLSTWKEPISKSSKRRNKLSPGPEIEVTQLKTYEPRSEKTCLRGFRPGPTQTELYSPRRWLEA